MCGAQLYVDFQRVDTLVDRCIITDPVVTRLFIITLFFSTPLHYHHDSPTPTSLLKKNASVVRVQSAYASLLWKYLLHRHGDGGAVRIFADLVRVYLKMQLVGYGIYTHLRTQRELMATHETLQKLVSLQLNDDSESTSGFSFK
jgi:hypothetical protein